MILHFLTDDKFSNYAIKQFEGEDMRSDFVVVSHTEDLKYFDLNSRLRIVNPDSGNFNDLVNNLGKYKAIILHGLFWPWQETILKTVPSNVKVGWVFWGGDIYGRQDIKRSFLSSRSKALLFCHSIISLIKRKKSSKAYEIPIELLKRIDYCLTDIHEDLEYVTDYVGKEYKELWYNYYSIEETIGALKDSCCNGGNILLGNSATLECNHFDGMIAIKKNNISDSKVFIPLSYGLPWVKHYITKIGKALFKDNTLPLCDFMPLEEYNKIILSCSSVVMPHYRPQAFGNIITALWLGCRVYLSKNNHLFSFFKRIGCIVFSIENDSINCSPVTESEREHNRAILYSLYSYDRMRGKNIELIKVLES